MSIRILVVDDYEPWRRFVCSTLCKKRELQVICEASDGLEAVRRAEELQPDLIVLDIGLPKLNGIEAARRIRKLSPESEILFLSQESSADVVREALSLGALGYVVKAHAGSELLGAVEAVCQGSQFVSGGVPRKAEITHSHEVQFYSDDAAFLVGFSRFIEAALKAGNPVIVVATESHQNRIFQRLQAQGLNIGAAVEQGRYIPLDVADTLSTFMVNDLPERVRFLKVAGDLVTAAAKGGKGEHSRVAACGECAPILWAQGKLDAAVQLEHLWDEIAKISNMDILCGYVLNSFQREQENHIYERICAEHAAVCSR